MFNMEKRYRNKIIIIIITFIYSFIYILYLQAHILWVGEGCNALWRGDLSVIFLSLFADLIIGRGLP